ncbi:MAG: DUF1203 domain-containing protein [Alphaproteobacteria bacterium]
MTVLRYVAIPSDRAGALRAGAIDANGHAPERKVSDGGGLPCRHCLDDVAAGAPYLVLAYRPFPAAQPYAEVGPIFVHADPCPRHDENGGLPPIVTRRETVLMRGYGQDDRIVYGTGSVVRTGDLESAAAALLARNDIAYVHVRSASYNCFQFRIDRN